MKLGVLRTLEGGRVAFWCAGCKELHQVKLRDGDGGGWDFNGDFYKPTFAPSIKVTGVEKLTDAEYGRVRAGEKIEKPATICHSFVTDGNIRFLEDCTHEFAGLTLPLAGTKD